MSTNKQRRAAAKRKLARQNQKRAHHAKVAHQRMMIIGVVVAVIVIAGGAWLTVSLIDTGNSGTNEAAGASTATSSTTTTDAGNKRFAAQSDGDSASGTDDPDTTATGANTATGGAAAGSAGDTECSYPASGKAAKPVDPPSDLNPPHSGSIDATIALNSGDVQVSLDRSNAPCAINSFVSLAGQHYFADTPCHRLTTAATLKVLQCGDPTGTGTGGPGYSFADELTGHEQYTAGTLAMANAGADTNGSQFFIVYGDSQLPPKYTVLGHVTKGLDVVQHIADKGVKGGGQDGKPADAVTIKKVTVGT